MKTKMKEDLEEIPWHTYGIHDRNHRDPGHCCGRGHSIVSEALRFMDLTIRPTTDCVDLGHVTVDIIFALVASENKLSSYQDTECSSCSELYCITSILTFGPYGSASNDSHRKERVATTTIGRS